MPEGEKKGKGKTLIYSSNSKVKSSALVQDLSIDGHVLHS